MAKYIERMGGIQTARDSSMCAHKESKIRRKNIFKIEMKKVWQKHFELRRGGLISKCFDASLFDYKKIVFSIKAEQGRTKVPSNLSQHNDKEEEEILTGRWNEIENTINVREKQEKIHTGTGK